VDSLSVYGNLGGSDSFVVNGLFTWSPGVIGVPSITANGGITIDGSPNSGGHGLDTTIVNNAGIATWTGVGGYLSDGAAFNNLAGATFFDQTEFNTGFAFVSGSVNNAGTYVKSTNTTTQFTGGPFNNSGVVQVNAGILQFSGAYTQTAGSTSLNGGSITGSLSIQGGVLSGNGNIVGNVTNGGQVSPGSSPGAISVSGNYTQIAAGDLAIELGGTAPGTGYDQVVVGASVTLAGTLHLSLVNGFRPALNDQVTIINNHGANAVTGQFANLAEGAIISLDCTKFQITYHGSGNSVVLTAVAVHTTPTVTLSAANATYTGAAYASANLTPTVTPADAPGSVSYVFYSDAAGQNAIATPINAGTYYVRAFFASTDPDCFTDAHSDIVRFSITAKPLSVDVTTQGTINIAKEGTISFALQITGGLIAGNNDVAALFNGAVFTIHVDGTSYSLTSTATVGAIEDLKADLAQALEAV